MHPQDPAVPSTPAAAHPQRAARRRWLGSLVALLVVGALAGGAWYLVQRSAGGGAGGPPRGLGGGGRPMVTVGYAQARLAALPVQIDALGTATPLATVVVRPQVSGVLQQVLFTEGQMVQKGQLLAQIDPRPFEQALLQAQGTRQRDEAQLANARLTLQRYRTLLEQDSIARQDVDTQAALVQQLQGTVVTDKAQEGAARLNLDHTRLTAPISGRIGLRAVDPGNYVTAGDAAGIATITQMAPMDVQFAVPQDRVADIQEAHAQAQAAKQPLAVTAWDRTRTTQLGAGTFLTLDNLVDVGTGTVKAKARFANAGGALFPNQFVNVRLQLRAVQAVLVPVTAVRTGAHGDFVYVVNDDRTVALRQVTRGQATVEQIAITHGLQAGERVVTEGGDRLQDGATVQLQGQAPAAGPKPGERAGRGGPPMAAGQGARAPHGDRTGGAVGAGSPPGSPPAGSAERPRPAPSSAPNP